MAIVVSWDTGLPAASGATVDGTPTYTTAASGFEWAIIPNSATATANRVRWTVASMSAYTVRYYLGIPRSLDAAAPTDIYRSSVSGTAQIQHTFPPETEQGSLRFKGSGGVVIDTVDVGTLNEGQVLRVESRVSAGVIRLGLFRLGADTPFYDSGDIADPAQVAVTQHSFGHHANTPSGGPWAISRIRVDDTAADWIGRHASDTGPSVPATIIRAT